MGINDRHLLDQMLQRRARDTAPELTPARFFELFVADELLKHYAISDDDLDAGLVAGGNDGGIDGLYAFVDDELLTSDFDFKRVKARPILRLVIIQAKQSTGYSESTINNLISTTHDLLAFHQPLQQLAGRYNSQLLAVIADYRKASNELADKFAIHEFNYFYVTKGESDQVHPNVMARVSTLEAKVRDYFTDHKFTFSFLGAAELLELARRQVSTSLRLTFHDQMIASDEGVIGLVLLNDYFNFITDEEGRRRQVIFDANVREYEGDVEVNRDIRETLQEGAPQVNFWWLNNGITIVAERAPLIGKTVTLNNPKVVNGLQTSQEIYRYFMNNPQSNDPRTLLVRVIVTADSEVRNLVIKATNNQTRISPYSLYATEPIHQGIEQDFEHYGLYYDRQRNYYKNQGVPRNSIVTIQYLAQAVAAIILQEAYNSRGRPTNLMRDPKKRAQLFSPKYEIVLYRKCAQLMKLVDDYLRRDAEEFARRERTNLRFQLAMFVTMIKCKSLNIRPSQFAKTFSVDDIDIELLNNATRHVFFVFDSLRKKHQLDGDRIAKNVEYDDFVKLQAEAIISGRINLEDTPA